MSLTYNPELLRLKGDEYCKSNSTSLLMQLGSGTQGIVYKTNRNTAIKVHGLEAGYKRERSVYIKLREQNIQSIRGMMIPRILTWDDALLTFEMSIVHVPSILDFGGAYTSEDPPDHMIRDEIWQNEKAQEFGSNWPEAQKIIKEIEYRGQIWLVDVNTGNIRFEKAL